MNTTEVTAYLFTRDTHDLLVVFGHGQGVYEKPAKVVGGHSFAAKGRSVLGHVAGGPVTAEVRCVTSDPLQSAILHCVEHAMVLVVELLISSWHLVLLLEHVYCNQSVMKLNEEHLYKWQS